MAKKVEKVEKTEEIVEELETTGHIGPDDSNLIAPEGTEGYIGSEGPLVPEGVEGTHGGPIGAEGAVGLPLVIVIANLEKEVTTLKTEIERLKNLPPITVEKIVEIPIERIVEVEVDKIVKVEIGNVNYKFNVGEEVYYPSKYQRMRFEIKEQQGKALGQPLYRIFSKHFEDEIERVPENELLRF